METKSKKSNRIERYLKRKTLHDYIRMLPLWLRLPEPDELGKCESMTGLNGLPSCALPMRDFYHEPGAYTWDDYNKDMQEKYPIKYFIYNTLNYWFAHKLSQLKQFKYMLRSNTTKKYHLLDLRQPKNNYEPYRWGWIDSDTQMLYALFNILVNYYEREEDVPARIAFYESEHHDPETVQQLKDIKMLYEYWKIERSKKRAEIDNLLMSLYGKDCLVSDSAKEILRQDLRDLEDEFSKDEDEKLKQILSVRKIMWT